MSFPSALISRKGTKVNAIFLRRDTIFFGGVHRFSSQRCASQSANLKNGGAEFFGGIRDLVSSITPGGPR